MGTCVSSVLIPLSTEYIYEVCLEGIQPCNMKNRDIYWRTNKIKETLYIGQWCFSSLQSEHLGTSHGSPYSHYLPYHVFLNLIYGLKSLPFQRWFLVWGKARSRRAPNLGYRGAESPGWFDVLPKNSAGDLMHERAQCDEAAKHQLPIVAAFWIIRIVSGRECSSLMQNLMQIRCSTC